MKKTKMPVLAVRIPSELMIVFQKKVKSEMRRIPDVVRSLIVEYVKDASEEKPSE